MTDHVTSLESGPVNLDGMDLSGLYKFAAATRGMQPRRAARRLFGNQAHAVAATRQLCCYALNKVTAMACRERGEIQTAQRYEKNCERIYEQLPVFARW